MTQKNGRLVSESNSLEAAFLENELKDVLQPNILLSKLSQSILEMLMEYHDYTSKKGESEANKRSKKRLMELLNISTELSGVGDLLSSFKLFNKELVGRITLLNIENRKLNNELEIHRKTFEEL